MLIGVMSDTHGEFESTRGLLRLFESLGVELIIHCGDLGPASMTALFSAWPTHFVLGNCDNRLTLASAIAEAGQTFHERFGWLELEGKRIAFLHGHDGDRFRQAVYSGEWDLVCHGHTHEAQFGLVGRTLVLNPGAISRSSRPSGATVELPSMRVTTVTL